MQQKYPSGIKGKGKPPWRKESRIFANKNTLKVRLWKVSKWIGDNRRGLSERKEN